METREKRRNNTGEKQKNTNSTTVNNLKKKINIIGLLVIITIIMLLCIYLPRAIELYNRYKEEESKDSKAQAVIYPLEIKLDANQMLDLNDMTGDYFTGIKTNVEDTDGFTNKEMIEFAISVLTEKYSSSGVIPSVAMDTVITRYFGVSGIDYKKEGYKTIKTRTESKESKVNTVILFSKLKQLEKDSDNYEIEAHEISKQASEKDAYDEKDIISTKTILVKKVLEKDANGEVATNQKDNIQYVFVKSIVK